MKNKDARVFSSLGTCTLLRCLGFPFFVFCVGKIKQLFDIIYSLISWHIPILTATLVMRFKTSMALVHVHLCDTKKHYVPIIQPIMWIMPINYVWVLSWSPYGVEHCIVMSLSKATNLPPFCQSWCQIIGWVN